MPHARNLDHSGTVLQCFCGSVFASGPMTARSFRSPERSRREERARPDASQAMTICVTSSHKVFSIALHIFHWFYKEEL